MPSRPEVAAPPEIYYDDATARRYTSNSRITEIQNSMSERALELLALPKDGVPKLLLDLGCGSGLSGESITQNEHHWIGLDISTSMNNIALEREVAGYFLLGDMGQGLEFRPGMFDGAISISTVEWLCNAVKSCHNPDIRLKCLKIGARAVFQVFPENLAQRELICKAGFDAGFNGALLVDYSLSRKKRKDFLIFTCGIVRNLLPKREDEGEENKRVYISDRQRPRKNQNNINKNRKGRELIKRKKEQKRRSGNDVPPDT